MAVLLERINTQSPYFNEVEGLMNDAFPQEERRPQEAFKWLTDNENHFSCNALLYEKRLIGLLTYWDLGRFTYVEHLATWPWVRGKGWGADALAALKVKSSGNIVLEVEPPVDELTRRRVAFYRRNGFQLWDKSVYRQPPYGPGLPAVDLQLMVYGTLDENVDFSEVRRVIHTVVYGLEEPLL